MLEWEIVETLDKMLGRSNAAEQLLDRDSKLQFVLVAFSVIRLTVPLFHGSLAWFRLVTRKSEFRAFY